MTNAVLVLWLPLALAVTYYFGRTADLAASPMDGIEANRQTGDARAEYQHAICRVVDVPVSQLVVS